MKTQKMLESRNFRSISKLQEIPERAIKSNLSEDVGMLIFIPGLGGRGSPDGAKKISGRLPPTRSHPRQLEALDTHGFSQPLPISSYQ